MKKISFAAFGAVFGGLVVGGADASIISRGFLDEALESYATTTALDLKADKADLTALSDKIGNAWPYMPEMSPGLHSLSWGLYPSEMNLENTSDLVRFLFGGQMESGINEAGVLNLLGQSVYYTGAYDKRAGQIDDGFRSLTQLTNGWTDSKKRTYLGVKGLNDAIGTLPTGTFDIGAGGLNEMFGKEKSFPVNVPSDSTLSELFRNLYELGASLPSIADVAYKTMFGGELSQYWAGVYGMPSYKGLIDLTKDVNKIGTLPSGAMPLAPVWSDKLFQYMYQEYGVEPIYPTSLAGLMELLFGSSQKDSAGILQRMVAGFPEDYGTDNLIGLYPNYILAKEANDKIGTLPTKTFDIGNGGFSEMFSDGKSFPVTIPSGYTLSDLFLDLYTSGSPLPSISDVAYITMHGGELSQYWADVHGIEQYKGLLNLTKDIGTLPTGELPRVAFWTDTLLPALGIEPNYPTSLAGLMELLFGNNAHAGILPLIYRGVSVDTDGNGGRDTNIGILSNYSLATTANTAAQKAQTTANTAKSTADSAIDKIGRLPTEYSTVGAALSAMDAKIEAKDLPADSDDGQYVLSAKKVGDTITYTWVKMDLTDAEK